MLVHLILLREIEHQCIVFRRRILGIKVMVLIYFVDGFIIEVVINLKMLLLVSAKTIVVIYLEPLPVR